MATVEELIDAAEARIEETQDEATGYLDDLLAIVQEILDPQLPDNFDYNSVPIIDVPLFFGGFRPSGDIPAPLPLPDVPVPVIPAVQDIALPVDDLLAPSYTFAFFEAAYESTLLDPLKAKLLNDLVNGGYGIDTADENALFQRMRDRETAAAMQRVDEVGRTLATRGFPLPPGEFSIQLDRAHQDLQDKLSSASREIFIDASKRFVENRQFTIREVKELETVLIGFHNSVQERALNVAKAAQEFSIAVFNALVARYRTRLDAARISGEVQNLRFQAEELRVRAALESYRTHALAFELELRRRTDEQKIKTELFRADIDSHKGLTDGFVARAALQQKVIEATATQNTDVSRLNVENSRVRLGAQAENLKMRAEAAKFAAATTTSLLAAMVSTMNTLAVKSLEE